MVMVVVVVVAMVMMTGIWVTMNLPIVSPGDNILNAIFAYVGVSEA